MDLSSLLNLKPSRRFFLVLMGSVTLGRFKLPESDDESASIDHESNLPIREVLTKPSRVWRDDGSSMLLWVENRGFGKSTVMIWNPETEEEIRDAEEFYIASYGFDKETLQKRKESGSLDEMRKKHGLYYRSEEEQDLIRKIHCDFSDNKPKLAYANFLDSQGDSTGQFIRQQIGRQAFEPEDFDPYKVSDQREKECLKHTAEIFKPLAEIGVFPIQSGTYQPDLWLDSSGLLVRLIIDEPIIFPAEADYIFDVVPMLHELTLLRDGIDIEGIASLEKMNQITHLDIFSDKVSSEDFIHLFTSNNLSKLQQLKVSGGSFEMDSFETMLQSPILRQLKTLGLPNCELHKFPLEKLFGSSALKNLQLLDVSNNSLTAEDLAELNRTIQLENLIGLILSGNPIGDAQIESLCSNGCLANFKNLSLNDCLLTEKALQLLEKCSLHCLKTLNLDSNKIGPKGIAALLKNESLNCLETLSLNETNLGASGIKELALWPGMKTVDDLNLAGNQVNDIAIHFFATSASAQNLRNLDLDSNQITARGIESLVANRHIKSLNWLCLSNNPIGLDGAKILAKSKWKNLQRLLLNFNDVGEEAVPILEEKFGKDVLCIHYDEEEEEEE